MDIRTRIGINLAWIAIRIMPMGNVRTALTIGLINACDEVLYKNG